MFCLGTRIKVDLEQINLVTEDHMYKIHVKPKFGTEVEIILQNMEQNIKNS